MWYIVKFPQEETVEAVPVSWYNSSMSRCFWPPNSFKREKVMKMIQKNEEPKQNPQDGWELHPCELIGTSKYDNFHLAQLKANKATLTSDLSSSDAGPIPKKRRRIKNTKYETDSSSDTSDPNTYPSPIKQRIDSYSVTNPKKIINIEGNYVVAEDSCLLPVDLSPDNITLNAMLTPRLSTSSGPSHFDTPKLPFTTRTSQQFFGESRRLNEPGTSQVSIANNAPNNFAPSSPATSLTSGQQLFNNASDVLSDQDFKKMVINEFSILNLKLDSQSDKIGAVVDIIRQKFSNSVKENVNLDAAIIHSKIPIKSLENLIEFEEWLNKDEDNFNLLVLELRRLGGKSYGHATRRILYRIMENNVAEQFSWEGAKKKQSFKNLRLSKAILDSLRQLYPGVLENDVINVIKVWLVKARQRLASSTTSAN